MAKASAAAAVAEEQEAGHVRRVEMVLWVRCEVAESNGCDFHHGCVSAEAQPAADAAQDVRG